MAAKAHQLSRDLKRRISKGEWSHGQRLPSKQALSVEYDVSPATVANAFRALRQSRLVRSVPGKGIYVVDPGGRTQLAGGRQRTIALAGSYVPQSSAIDSDFRSVQRAPIIDGIWAAAREAGCCLVLLSETDTSIDHEVLGRMKVDGVILLGLRYSEEELLKFRHSSTAAIMANFPGGPTPINYVDYDNCAMVRSCVHKFAQAGHRKIAFMGVRTSVAGYVDLLEVHFVKALLAEGLVYDYSRYWRVGKNPHGVGKKPHEQEDKSNHSPLRGDDVWARVGAELAEDILGADEPPTAIFCWQDALLPGLEQVIAKRGLRVPQDLSVITSYDFPQNARYSGFGIPHVQLGRELLLHLFETIDHPSFYVQKLLSCPYVDRDSVGTLPAEQDKQTPLLEVRR